MSANTSQTIEPVELTDLPDYNLSGDDSTVERKLAFLQAYRIHGVVSRATYEARIHRTTVYKWLDSDEAFVQAFADCHEDTYDELEASGYQKALAGDPILTMFYLKAHRPKFRDRVSIDIDSVRDEIRERMQQAGINARSVLQLPQVLQIPSESENKQKD